MGHLSERHRTRPGLLTSGLQRDLLIDKNAATDRPATQLLLDGRRAPRTARGLAAPRNARGLLIGKSAATDRARSRLAKALPQTGGAPKSSAGHSKGGATASAPSSLP